MSKQKQKEQKKYKTLFFGKIEYSVPGIYSTP